MLYQRWRMLNVDIEQPLARAVRGPTLVAFAPDGRQLRVCIRDVG